MNIICAIFGHKYAVLRVISKRTRELYCKRCKREFGMNDDTKSVLPLTDSLKEGHEQILGNCLFEGNIKKNKS